MIFDGICLRKIVAELRTALIGGKLNKVFAPSKNELFLSFYSHGLQYALAISIASDCYHLNLTTRSKPNPLKASNFCMLLRKHLIGFHLEKIEMKDLERIVFFRFTGYNEMNDPTSKTLVVELMGKHSNVLLLNDNQTIIDSLRHLDIDSGSMRDILPAHPYTMPSSSKKSLLACKDIQAFIQLFEKEQGKPLDQVIPAFFTGISKNYVQAFLNEKQLSNEVTPEILQAFYQFFQEELEKIHVTETSSTPILTLNFACDDFYAEKEEKQIYESFRSNLIRLVSEDLKKVRKKLEHMEEKLKECDSMEKYKLYGELLTANLYQYKTERLSEITLSNYYNNEEITIPLEDRYSLADNAKRYFKKYTKLKNAFEIVQKQKKETLQELDYLGSILYEIEEANTLEDLTNIYEEMESNLVYQSKKSAPSKYTIKEKSSSSYLSFTIDGYPVYVGKNNLQNDELTLKVARKTDYWFHTKEIHGSHVILRVESGKPEPSMDTLVKCAKLAAKYSKARYSSSVPVDYTQVKYVKKPSGAKPGMVIYTNYKTIYVTNELK